MGWFPESYVERVAPSDTANNTAAPAVAAAAAVAPKLALQSQLSNALEAVKAAGTKSAFTPTHSPNPAPSDTQGQVRGLHLPLYDDGLDVWKYLLCCLSVPLTEGGG